MLRAHLNEFSCLLDWGGPQVVVAQETLVRHHVLLLSALVLGFLLVYLELFASIESSKMLPVLVRSVLGWVDRPNEAIVEVESKSRATKQQIIPFELAFVSFLLNERDVVQVVVECLDVISEIEAGRNVIGSNVSGRMVQRSQPWSFLIRKPTSIWAGDSHQAWIFRKSRRSFGKTNASAPF